MSPCHLCLLVAEHRQELPGMVCERPVSDCNAGIHCGLSAVFRMGECPPEQFGCFAGAGEGWQHREQLVRFGSRVTEEVEAARREFDFAGTARPAFPVECFLAFAAVKVDAAPCPPVDICGLAVIDAAFRVSCGPVPPGRAFGGVEPRPGELDLPARQDPLLPE